MNGKRIRKHVTTSRHEMPISEMDNSHLSNALNVTLRVWLDNHKGVYTRETIDSDWKLAHPNNSEHVLGFLPRTAYGPMHNPYFRNLLYRLSVYLKQI